MALKQPDGYLALPASGSGHPVLVLHPWWGLNGTIKAFTDQLAEAGFLAFAADLYHGNVTDQIPEAENLAHSLDEEQAIADVAAVGEHTLACGLLLRERVRLSRHRAKSHFFAKRW